MPMFSFLCRDCGKVFDDIVATADMGESVCPRCLGVADKLFSPTTNLRLAPWMTREAEDANARQRAFLERDEVKARFKAGEYEIDSSDPYCTNADSPNSTSSVSAMAEEAIIRRELSTGVTVRHGGNDVSAEEVLE